MRFSFIVTVYNVEQYLRDCVDSILAQTFEDFELILVDDGSPDGCPSICDAYAAADVRVRVIHQKNSGIVNARIAGLRTVMGEYVVFVDGDDWIAPTYLAHSAMIISKTDADLILFDFSREYMNRSEIVRNPASAGLYDRAGVRKAIYPSLLMDSGMAHMSYSVFGKVFSRTLVEKGLLAVDPRITLGEDLLRVLHAYMEAESVYICHEVMNFYRVREQSASHGYRMECFDQIRLVLNELERIKEKEPDMPDDFDEQVLRYGAFMCFTMLVHAANDGRMDALVEIRQEISSPSLRSCIERAKFKGITPKTHICFFLMRRGWIRSAYLFLRLCRWVKQILK